METYETWSDRMQKEAKDLGFREGYKILYVPWSTIGTTDTVFLSLNPGRAPNGADLETLSDERGNSYEVERAITASPITEQFLQLAEILDRRPSEILTGVVAPFRSARWRQTSKTQRLQSLLIGEEFWRQVFAVRRPAHVIAVCPEAERIAVKLLKAQHELTLLSGWGNVRLHRHRSSDGALVVRLPHLSTFKLLSRPECRQPLLEVLAHD